MTGSKFINFSIVLKLHIIWKILGFLWKNIYSTLFQTVLHWMRRLSKNDNSFWSLNARLITQAFFSSEEKEENRKVSSYSWNRTCLCKISVMIQRDALLLLVAEAPAQETGFLSSLLPWVERFGEGMLHYSSVMSSLFNKLVFLGKVKDSKQKGKLESSIVLLNTVAGKTNYLSFWNKNRAREHFLQCLSFLIKWIASCFQLVHCLQWLEMIYMYHPRQFFLNFGKDFEERPGHLGRRNSQK